MSVGYNINLCGICQISSNLKLINTSAVAKDGESYLQLLEFIFKDISWAANTLSLACYVCIKKIKKTAEFKRICLDTNDRSKRYINDLKSEIDDLLNDNADELTQDILDFEDGVNLFDDKLDSETEDTTKSKTQTEEVNLEKEDTLLAHKDSGETASPTKRKRKPQELELKNDTILLPEDKLNKSNEERDATKRKSKRQKIALENDSQILKDNVNSEAEKQTIKNTRQKVVKKEQRPIEKEVKDKKIKKKVEDIEESEKEINKIKDYNCEFCRTLFHTLDKFDRHVFKHNGIRKYKCNICDTKFITTQDLSAHKRLWCRISKTSCSLCQGKKKFSPELLAVHMKVEHMIVIPSKGQTNVINKESGENDRDDDIQINGGKRKRKKIKQKILTCHICQMEFTRSTHLDKHVYNHDGTKSHDCHDCGTKFITTDDLRNHKRVVHLKKEDYKFLCMECGMRFPISSGLQMHMLRSHTNNRNFTCDICHKSFYEKRDVENHLTTHSNTREFKCDLCPAEYKRKQVLQVHKFKAHGIGVCNRKAVDKYKCPFCMKIISSKAKLPRHIRTHTGVKPYKCRLCDSRFTCNSYVKNHLKQKHHMNVETSDFNVNMYYDICEMGDPIEENAGIRVVGDEDDEEPINITCDV